LETVTEMLEKAAAESMNVPSLKVNAGFHVFVELKIAEVVWQLNDGE